MTAVALISQPLRWGHLSAHIEDAAERDWLVIASPLLSTASVDLPPTSQLIVVTEGLDRIRVSWRHHLRARFLKWSRGDSRAGPVVERLIRSLRSYRAPSRGAEEETVEKSDPGWLVARTKALVTELEKQHIDSVIEQLVVFDVYDLPAALEFAIPRSIPVVVR